MRAAHSVFCSRGPQAAPSAPMAPQALGLPLLSAPRPVGWQLLSSCSHWTPAGHLWGPYRQYRYLRWSRVP